MNAQHSAATPRWGTPPDIIQREKHVIGAFDLDPCSEGAFLHIVNAKKAYCLEDRGEDGLKLPWFGRVHVNPPGGYVRDFWLKMFSEPVDQAFWIGFSLEQLAQLADCEHHPLDFSCVIPRKRIGFTRHDGYRASPSHSNYIVGINVSHDLFKEAFGDLGKITFGDSAI